MIPDNPVICKTIQLMLWDGNDWDNTVTQRLEVGFVLTLLLSFFYLLFCTVLFFFTSPACLT